MTIRNLTLVTITFLLDIPFLVFSDEKEKICQPFIPNSIPEGMRHNTMLSVLSNRVALNPHCNEEYLISISEDVLYKMDKKIPKQDVNRIITYILRLRDDGELRMYLNKERRILLNPNIYFTRKQKYMIISRENGKIRSNKTRKLIYDTIESWDFELNGKITQKKVAEKVLRGEGTIKKYWSAFKDYVRDLNTDYSLCDKPS